jgi:hypothetical protein
MNNQTATPTPIDDVLTIGVPVSEKDRAPAMFALRDQDGNRLEIVESA